jgi:hypothetical protein
VRLRRLALAPAALVVAGLATSGCAQQSAAVRVNDQTVSRTELYEELGVLAENKAFQAVVLRPDADPSQIPGDLGGSYAQPVVGSVIQLRIQGMLATEVLADQGIEVSDAEIKRLDDSLAQGMREHKGNIESLPDRYRRDFVTGVAAYGRLVTKLGSKGAADQALFQAQSDADISVSSEFGSWDPDRFAVDPPRGSGSGAAGSTSG